MVRRAQPIQARYFSPAEIIDPQIECRFSTAGYGGTDIGQRRLPQGELSLKQEFQMLSGTLTTGGASAPISNARMNGDRIVFTVGGAQYTGQVKGGTIEGTVKSSDGTRSWSATRAGKAA